MIQDTNTLKWTIPALGVSGSEGATLQFLVQHVGPDAGLLQVNRSISYQDTEGNQVSFPDPYVTVDCGINVQPEPCPQPAKLDFSDMPAICATYERVTRMHIYERTPYAGQLVFAAFSGSHQDAIAKGMAYRKQTGEHRWTCPYIPVDPHDIGRTYDADVIRINSQSGKGGIGFVLEQNYGYNLPPKMREALGYKVKSVSDHSHKELSAAEVLHIFEDTYLNRAKPLNVVEAHFAQVNGITATVTLELNGQRKVVTSVGNGRLDAVANAIQSATGMDFHLENYSEHSLDEGSTSRAASYVGLVWGDNTVTWGAGTDTDIIVAGIRALVSAINNR